MFNFQWPRWVKFQSRSSLWLDMKRHFYNFTNFQRCNPLLEWRKLITSGKVDKAAFKRFLRTVFAIFFDALGPFLPTFLRKSPNPSSNIVSPFTDKGFLVSTNWKLSTSCLFTLRSYITSNSSLSWAVSTTNAEWLLKLIQLLWNCIFFVFWLIVKIKSPFISWN